MNLALKTRDSACTGNKNVGLRLGSIHQWPLRQSSAPQAISACTWRWRRRSCVQVCSTSVKAADAAQPARVGGELGERRGHAAHQRVVDPARVQARQPLSSCGSVKTR